MHKKHFPCVVSIAGTDPSGGAGIQADIKAISATGAYAGSIITALVAQNTQGVMAIQEISTDFVRQQFNAVFSDLQVHAVKIGMLHSKEIIETVFDELKKVQQKNVVFDPVMLAKDGAALLDMNTIEFLKQSIKGAITLITPNLSEAGHLLGTEIKTNEDMAPAARKLAQELNINVLLKGGHLQGPQSSDVLYLREEDILYWFHSDRITTKNTHGTGCSLSSAIASYLAQGFGLSAAVSTAKSYLSKAIQAATRLEIGQGNGPIDHFYFLENRSSEIHMHQ